MATKTQKSGVTLVLGTGLLKCSASLGTVNVLNQEAIPIAQIIGSGPGAIFAAAIGLGYTQAQVQAIVTDLSNFYKYGKISTFKRLQIAMPRLFGLTSSFGVLDGDAYHAIFQKHFGSKTFADLKLPTTLVATNFVNGQRVLLTQGSLAEAVSASCIIPGVIPPRLLNNHLVVGGAVSDPIPVNVAMEQGGDVIVTMGFDSPYLDQIGSIRDVIYQMNNVHTNHLVSSQLALSNLAHHDEIISISPKFGIMVGLDDDSHFNFLVEKGAEATQSVVPYLKKRLAETA